MSNLKGKEYKRFESIKHVRTDGSEYWSARELAPALEYVQWRNFTSVLKRAMIACENSGHSVLDDFAEVSKIVEDLPTPDKSIQQIEKEQMERLKKKAKEGKLMLDEEF